MIKLGLALGSKNLFHSLRHAPSALPSASIPTPSAPPAPTNASQTQTAMLPSVTTSPKIPSISVTNRVKCLGEKRTGPLLH
ncbi:hypothetical protein SKAU_G00354560 [Synaphobranchus kaupii]|uniref:Uncharacterized protein n=1 Tax=Synaphobranchus kaupii TaxID=118154 RepID=A0A9Q1IFH6_SYNKA|nr:hypothetical protein SKAU_G00354560 [Synaphobranchus kaupii]